MGPTYKRVELYALALLTAAQLTACVATNAKNPSAIISTASFQKEEVSSPDISQAYKSFPYAILPTLYESSLANKLSDSAARKKIQLLLPKSVELIALRQDNTTAIVAHDRATNSIYVAFDGSSEFGDILDNLKANNVPHALGGVVHGGLHKAITKRDQHNQRFVDRVGKQVLQYAENADTPAHIIIAGFSRGGALATAAMAEWIIDGLFTADTHPSKISETTLFTYGSPPYGDIDFTLQFIQRCDTLGIKNQRLIVGGDEVPFHFTTQANYSRFFGLDNKFYYQVGAAIYILPDPQRGATVSINPHPQEISKSIATRPDVKTWHNISVYGEYLKEAYHAQTMDIKEALEKLEKIGGHIGNEAKRLWKRITNPEP